MPLIYNIHLKHGIVLAPMSGYTDWPMRLLCRRYGAELAYTEMISAEGLVMSTKNTLRLLKHPDEDRPLVAQIFTSSPMYGALAAEIIEDQGFEGIDINMGCPVRKVVKKGAGAALMRDPQKVLEIVESVISKIRLPVSVKIRAGWDAGSINAPEIAEMLCSSGINAIIVHPRTRAEMYRPGIRWELIGEIKKRVSIPVIASGDIHSQSDVGRIKRLGADGVMLGRATIGRPWIFMEIMGGNPPGPLEKRDVMLEHLDTLCTTYGERKGVLRMRKYISAYVKGLDGASAFRCKVNSILSAGQLRDNIHQFFNG